MSTLETVFKIGNTVNQTSQDRYNPRYYSLGLGKRNFFRVTAIQGDLQFCQTMGRTVPP